MLIRLPISNVPQVDCTLRACRVLRCVIDIPAIMMNVTLRYASVIHDLCSHQVTVTIDPRFHTVEAPGLVIVGFHTSLAMGCFADQDCSEEYDEDGGSMTSRSSMMIKLLESESKRPPGSRRQPTFLGPYASPGLPRYSPEVKDVWQRTATRMPIQQLVIGCIIG
jgi:hypothetical protein